MDRADDLDFPFALDFNFEDVRKLFDDADFAVPRVVFLARDLVRFLAAFFFPVAITQVYHARRATIRWTVSAVSRFSLGVRAIFQE